MKNIRVARRYAKALFELAKETNQVDDVLQALGNVMTVLEKVPESKLILFNPLIGEDDKGKFIKTVTSNKVLLRFSTLLHRRKRLELLPAVYDELVVLSDEANGISRALVRTPQVLSEKQKVFIEKDLARAMGGRIMGSFEVAKDLIGGVWIKMGDHVLDATLKRRFEDLRHTLAHSTN